jgi:endo-1,3(4)-beta-glucanase
MLPINPTSAYTRSQEFVSQEWSHYFANGYVDTVQGGWRGVLMSNLALIDPVASFQFFNDSAFDWSWLDDGASRTWYLTYAAGMAGL